MRDAALLYNHLPEATRRSLRALATSGTAANYATVGHAVGLAIVRSCFSLARLQASEAATRVYREGTLPTEDDVVEEAVKLTRATRAIAV